MLGDFHLPLSLNFEVNYFLKPKDTSFSLLLQISLDRAVSSASLQENRGVPFMNKQNPFTWRHDEADSILLCVRWSLRYVAPLSRPGRDDAGTGTRGRSHDDLSLGAAGCS